jgi:hypothetical protein
MKFVFDRAVKGTEDGYNSRFTRSFSGSGPWVVLGQKFGSPYEWFQQAQRTARALGIKQAECRILPLENDETFFEFSFKNGKDYRAFRIATEGEVYGENKWHHTCGTSDEKARMLLRIATFLERNEIPANIVNVSDTKFTLITNSQLDYFTIMNAHEDGVFLPEKTEPSPPSPSR